MNALAFIAESMAGVLELFVVDQGAFFEWLDGEDDVLEELMDEVFE